MDDDQWIAHVAAGLDADQLAFLIAWHERIRSWPRDARADLRPVDEHDGCLVVFADLVDTDHHCSLLTLAAHYDGITVRADRVSSQHFVLPAAPSPDRLTAGGAPEELAERTASWFEDILRRRVLREEWGGRHKRVARRWLFARSGDALVVQGPQQEGQADFIYSARTEWS
ncbi:hypothetical protein GCM10009839_37680 [Catenulispora yoronensis]|uniref:Uncharacterized protein n=1 Tax=Catenulispora yoronensis TaxID=450799 RepID=A0ABN2UBQ5_9ACTN